MAGLKSNNSATSMVAGTKAITAMIDRAGAEGRIVLGQLLDAHRVLMAGDELDEPYSGRLRDVQNWIGGSDHSPRGAIHVPPPSDTVAAYMDDLVAYANRDDMPVLAQAAVVHAQFECIHPFTGGNGRIGRGLINAIVRRRGLTTTTVVPFASAMLAHRERYFDLLNDYRTGALHPFVSDVARSAAVASDAATISAAALVALPAYWSTLSKPRRGSTAAAVLDKLLDHPVISADDAAQLTGAKSTATYEALARLGHDGVVHEVRARKRDRIWAASARDHVRLHVGRELVSDTVPHGSCTGGKHAAGAPDLHHHEEQSRHLLVASAFRRFSVFPRIWVQRWCRPDIN
jgi:Fic family protein